MRLFKLFLLFSPLPLLPFYVGNPAEPALLNTGFFSTTYPIFKVSSGYLADYTSNKRYEENPAFNKMSLHSQMATGSLILLERVELFAMAGGSKESATTQSFFDFQGAYHFSWSAGAKAILIQWGRLFFSTDFTYFTIPSSDKSFFQYLNRLNLALEEPKQEFSLAEWQISAALSSRFYFLTPYVGGTYLNSTLHIEPNPTIGPLDCKNAQPWGWFFGVTMSLTGRFHLNFERRMGNEFAYTFSTLAVF